jgi:hypothetical protein
MSNSAQRLENQETREGSLVHWPIVATAAAGCLAMVAVLVAAVWALGRPGVVERAKPLPPLSMRKVPGEISSLDIGRQVENLPAHSDASGPIGDEDLGAREQTALTLGDEVSLPDAVVSPEPVEATFETFGTRLQFAANQAEASRQANRNDKLLFVLHISGNFEDDKFT